MLADGASDTLDDGARRVLNQFESIGDNCEFGFVQRALGVGDSALFRWTLVDSVAATVSGIRTSCRGAFTFENLEPAGAGTMVRDVTAGIAFHSAMRSVLLGDTWVFAAAEAERREIHARESLKLAHLASKFDRDIAGGARIYVAKRNAGLSEADGAAVFEAIAARGGGRLLYVTEAAEPRQAGTVELVHARLAHGWIDRFAPT